MTIVAEIDRVCLEHYGVGLTVMYWGDDRQKLDAFNEAGIRVLWIGDALGEGGTEKDILFQVNDGHPNAYANKRIGRYLAGVLAGD